MLPIIGYCTPWSGRPGDTIEFKISSARDEPFRSRVVEVIHADPNPAGPGMKLRETALFPAGDHSGKYQEAWCGSCAIVPFPRPADPRNFHLLLNVKPAKAVSQLGCMVAITNDAADRFVCIGLEAGEIVVVRGPGSKPVHTGLRPSQTEWNALGVGISSATGELFFSLARKGRNGRFGTPSQARLSVDIADAEWTTISVGALWRGHVTLPFDGFVERPSLFAGPLPSLPGDALAIDPAKSLACWDFGLGIEGRQITDAGPAGLHGRLVNLPTRGLRGSNWTGREMAWPRAAGEYGAICFHSDDLEDCLWETSVELVIPEGVKSGVYGLHVENSQGYDCIPFYVLPPKSSGARMRQRPKVVYLAPTLTYLAYANHARDNLDAAFRERIEAWNAYPHNPDDVRGFGFSTYNYHPGHMGVSLSSRLRPVLTMRPGYLTFNDQAGSGLRHFPADSHLTDWLDHQGIDFDVVTDEDLDSEGVDLIRDYDVLLTGSHPEYHTDRMLDALCAYRELGRNLVYLGGNGFYWKIARLLDHPHVMEIRRAESGIRAWASEPGEYYNQLDGAYGGLWRRNGRPPQMLAEIGFAVQGFFEGVGYHRTPESFDREHAWIFEGVKNDVFGDFGLSGGGAAGFELDQISSYLGTDPRTIVLARSAGHGPSFLGVPEDILTHVIAASAGKVVPEAHLVYSRNDAGSEIISVGSITFLGSLSHNNYDNDVSRLLGNVVHRFSSPRP
jgi:N,N-dimethylformamidase